MSNFIKIILVLALLGYWVSIYPKAIIGYNMLIADIKSLIE